jgi:hypothetical protein
LDLAAEILDFAFRLQVGVADGLAGRLLDFALHFVKLAFDLIVRAGVHLFFSLAKLWLSFGAAADLPAGRLHCEELAF